MKELLGGLLAAIGGMILSFGLLGVACAALIGGVKDTGAYFIGVLVFGGLPLFFGIRIINQVNREKYAVRRAELAEGAEDKRSSPLAGEDSESLPL